MIDLAKKLLTLALALVRAIPPIRRARERNAIRRAIAEHDEAEINRIFQQRRDRQ